MSKKSNVPAVGAFCAGVDEVIVVGEPEEPVCPVCRCPECPPLGRLGSRTHYRCRGCGMDFSRKDA